MKGCGQTSTRACRQIQRSHTHTLCKQMQKAHCFWAGSKVRANCVCVCVSQDALTSVRTDLALLQAERSALLHDKSELLRHIDSTSLRCRRLTDTLSAVLPLPPDLSQGLYDGLAGTLPAMQSTVVCEIDTVSGGYSESEEATDKMLSSSLSMLQKVSGCTGTHAHAQIHTHTSELGVGPHRARACTIAVMAARPNLKSMIHTASTEN